MAKTEKIAFILEQVRAASRGAVAAARQQASLAAWQAPAGAAVPAVACCKTECRTVVRCVVPAWSVCGFHGVLLVTSNLFSGLVHGASCSTSSGTAQGRPLTQGPNAYCTVSAQVCLAFERI